MFQFICLSLCIYVPPLTEYFFFRGFGYGPFRHCWDGHKHKKLTSVTNPREAGILGSYIPHFFENGLTFLSRIFCKTVPGVTTLQKITVWHSLLGVILGYFWAHFTVCSNISWEAFNIFSRNFIQMFLVYTNGYYTIFFFRVMSTCNPFWCTFLYFLRIVQYLLVKFCIDVCSTNLMVTALKLFIHILYFSADGHFGVILD